MFRSGLKGWGGWFALAVLWSVGVFPGARTATAGGCHAPERPTLGLSFAWEADHPSPPTLDRDAPAVAPVPCSGEVPGAVGREAPTRPDAAAPLDRPGPEPTGSRLVPDRRPLRALTLLRGRLDRPPRPFPALA